MLIPADGKDPGEVDVGEDGENELVERVAPGKIMPIEDGSRMMMASSANNNVIVNENCMYEIAKKRFNIDKERETVKLRQELELINQGAESDLFADLNS